MLPISHATDILENARGLIDEGKPCIWLVQTADEWLVDSRNEGVEDRSGAEAWRTARDSIDVLILNALLSGRIRYVRRAVLYDVSSDAGSHLARSTAEATAVHRQIYMALRSWKAELSRYLAMFDDGTAGAPLPQCMAPLAIQEIILGRVNSYDDQDRRVRSGEVDGCIGTSTRDLPDSWVHVKRSIPLVPNFGLPPEDENPLGSLAGLELSEYRQH